MFLKRIMLLGTGIEWNLPIAYGGNACMLLTFHTYFHIATSPHTRPGHPTQSHNNILQLDTVQDRGWSDDIHKTWTKHTPFPKTWRQWHFIGKDFEMELLTRCVNADNVCFKYGLVAGKRRQFSPVRSGRVSAPELGNYYISHQSWSRTWYHGLPIVQIKQTCPYWFVSSTKWT